MSHSPCTDGHVLGCPKAGNELLHMAVRWHRRLTERANACGFGRALDPAPARHHRELHQHWCSCYWAGNVSGCTRTRVGVLSYSSPHPWSQAHRNLVAWDCSVHISKGMELPVVTLVASAGIPGWSRTLHLHQQQPNRLFLWQHRKTSAPGAPLLHLTAEPTQCKRGAEVLLCHCGWFREEHAHSSCLGSSRNHADSATAS